MLDDSLPLNIGLRSYIQKIENHVQNNSGKKKTLSKVKWKILETLWNAGTSYPRDWVSSDELLRVTQQKYFDRRIRELRNEMGCDIKTGKNQGESAYRLLSENLHEAFDRTYLTASQKTKLFEQYEYQCSTCGHRFLPHQTGLEADHKIPLIRGGSAELKNWQPLCTGCNVAKRRSCQGCKIDCQTCAWAFPERYSRIIPLPLTRELEKQIEELSQRRDQSLQTLIIEVVQDWVTSELGNGEG